MYVRRGRSRLTTPIYGTVVAWRWYGRAMRFEPATIIPWYIIAVISWIPIVEHLDRRHRGILVTPLPALSDHLLATPPILQPISPYYTGTCMSSQLRSRVPSTWSLLTRPELERESQASARSAAFARRVLSPRSCAFAARALSPP